MTTRREILMGGGGILAAASLASLTVRAAEPTEIRMQGRPDGSHVWFDPIGIRIMPGQTIRWINLDPGNSHTATAYHPTNFGRARRMPDGAQPWNSDYLLPDESFFITFRQPGVYDYYCVPHEHAGMVGRIVVGTAQAPGWVMAAGTGDLPEQALRAFPTVEDIMQKGMIRHT